MVTHHRLASYQPAFFITPKPHISPPCFRHPCNFSLVLVLVPAFPLSLSLACLASILSCSTQHCWCRDVKTTSVRVSSYVCVHMRWLYRRNNFGGNTPSCFPGTPLSWYETHVCFHFSYQPTCTCCAAIVNKIAKIIEEKSLHLLQLLVRPYHAHKIQRFITRCYFFNIGKRKLL